MNQDSHQVKKEAVFCLLACMFVTILIVTNVVSSKICYAPFKLGSIPITPGDLFYPISFLISDVLCEIYGKRRSHQVVVFGIFCSTLATILVIFAVGSSPHPMWSSSGLFTACVSIEECQSIYASTLSSSGIIYLSSMVAFSVSQTLDVTIFSFLKKITEGKALWLRNNVSTITSQSVDTLLFFLAFFYLGLGFSIMETLTMAYYSFLIKALCAVFDTPFCYIACWALKRYIGEEKASCEVKRAVCV